MISNYYGPDPSWPGWSTPIPVVRINDPLEPAETIGYVQVYPITGGGRLMGFYYNGSLLPGVEGVTVSTSSSTSGTGFDSMEFKPTNSTNWGSTTTSTNWGSAGSWGSYTTA